MRHHDARPDGGGRDRPDCRLGHGGDAADSAEAGLAASLAAEAATVAAIWERPKDEEWGGWGYARHPDAGIVMKPAFRLMRTAVRSVMRSKDPNRADKVRDILRQAEEDIRNLNGEH